MIIWDLKKLTQKQEKSKVLNIYPTDEVYCKSFIRKASNQELSETESEDYSRYDLNLEEKAKQDASIIKNMIAEANAVKEAAKDINEKYDALVTRIEKAKIDLKAMLESNSINSLKTPYLEINIYKNPHCTNIYSEIEIPTEYIKETIVRTINKKQILEDLKQGVIIPGAEIQQKTRLEIK